MKTNHISLRTKEVSMKYIQIIGNLFLLSTLLGICMIILTPVPSEISLIRTLLTDIRVILLNVWPLFCIMTILYLITNRMWLSFSVISLISFVIAEINRLKITYRDDPFIFEDVLLFGEAKEMFGRYSYDFDWAFLYVFLLVALVAVGCFICFRPKIKNIYLRISGILGIAIIFAISCNNFYFNNTRLYNKTWHSEFGNEWKEANQCMSRGIVYSFIRSIPDAFLLPPEDYDEKEVEEYFINYQSVPMEEDKKVHIISIMLEAYNDFTEFDTIKFIKNPYKNFHDMQKNSYSGKLYTDIFAGGTIVTERSFLTGYSDTDFHKKDTQSYVRYFKAQGYYTEAMHPCYGWFYDRKNINQYLGFDDFDNYENKYGNITDDEVEVEKYHGMLSDYDFFDYIIEGYEDAVRKNQRYFNFSVTYQNHGPYTVNQSIGKEYIARKDGYTDTEYYSFNYYLDCIQKTDVALGKLRKFIDEQDEPVVLILFGDHNPYLGNNNNTYDMLGINIDFDTVEGAKNYYQTPYIFYANDAAKNSLDREFNEEGNTISPMFLMNELFEYIGIDGPAYLNYLKTVKNEYSVINPVYVGKNNEYTLKNEKINDKTLIEQQWIEYYVKDSTIKENN